MSFAASTYIWKHSRQRGSALLVLLALADMANSTGDCWPGINFLAERCRMSARNVNKILVQLIESGELVVNRNAGAKTPYGNTNHYHVPIRLNMATGGERGDTPEVSNRAEGGEQHDTPPLNVVTPKPSIEPSEIQPLFETSSTQVTFTALQVGVVATFPLLPSGQVDPQKPKIQERVESDEGLNDLSTETSDFEEITKSADDVTHPTPVPAHPFPEWTGIFTLIDAEIQGWLAKEPARLQAVCEYAAQQKWAQSPGGLARAMMRTPNCWPTRKPMTDTEIQIEWQRQQDAKWEAYKLTEEYRRDVAEGLYDDADEDEVPLFKLLARAT